MYLLDTDTLSNVLDKRRQNPHLRQKVLNAPSGSVAISIITVEEVLRGALDLIRQRQKSRKSILAAYTLLQELLQDLQRFPWLSLTEEAERFYQALPPDVKRIGTNDCRIAAIAQSQGYFLVTANTKHYAQSDGIQIENWMS